MPAGLTPQQNQRLKQVFNDQLVPRFGSAAAAAKALKRNQGQVSKWLGDKEGVGYRFAQAMAEVLGVSVAELLGEPTILRWENIPGFEAALRKAKETTDFPEEIWQQVGRISAPPFPERVKPEHLIATAEYVADLRGH